MKPNYIYLSTFLLLALPSCTDDSISGDGLPGDGSRKEVRLQASIDQTNVSRADDSGFSDGDRIGIFAVNFTDGTNPGTLTPADNLASNVGFSFNEASNSWEGDRQLYFKDDKTPVDFYGYYPYDYDMAEVEAYPFSVQRNQAAEAAGNRLSGYEASDFLWAKSAGVTPATPLVTLTFKHILAGVQVTLVEGTGFEEGEWAMLDKSVLVAGTNRDATINLATGETTLAGEGDAKSIIANPYRDDYRAVVIPQSVEAGNTLLSITVDGQSYEFTKEMTMTYLPSKLHKFTIRVEKPLPEGDFEFSLLDEAITAWESDLTSHNGSAKEYIIIDIPEAGTLSQVIKESGMNPAEIVNLKLTGFMNDADFEYIRNNIPDLEAINLAEIGLKAQRLHDVLRIGDENFIKTGLFLPDYAFCSMSQLKSCVFPKKIGAIGMSAFLGTPLSGSLEIPEGVIYIGSSAFENVNIYTSVDPDRPGKVMVENNLTGTLSLPSTLKWIGYQAFAYCNFQGELLLPEGIEEIENGVFKKCEYFTGDLHLPESLTKIGHSAFDEMKGITGWIILPSKLLNINGFSGMKPSGIQLPEKPIEIGAGAFREFEYMNGLKIPESVLVLQGDCFRNTKIKHLILPSGISSIPTNCFSGSELDSITIPDKVEVIESFAFNESKLESIVLSAKLQRIDNYAFRDCYNLNYIRCNAIEPPQISENAFDGVNKDNFTIEVPEQSVEAYRNAPGWSEFRRIAAYRNFVARPSKYNVLNRGGSREITLNADAGWEMTECPSWCHIDKTSGTQKTTLNLTVDPLSRGQQPRFGQITFRLKGDEEYLTHIDVGQYDYEYDEDEYLTIQKATRGNGIDIVIIGDGYDAADISSGLYLDDMKQEIEYFFAVEPYTTYRDYFNVYTAFALSDDSGVESINAWRNTKFHVSLGDGCGKDGVRLSADYVAALDYCAENVPPTISKQNAKIGCIIVANSDISDGITYIGESFCSVVSKSTLPYPSDARGVIQHEAGGHGFGWLGDEYIYHNDFIDRCSCPCCGHANELLKEHSIGHSLNLSLTGKYDDVPWKHLIFNPAYSDIVDIFEGGYFHSRGVYRSEGNSCMNNNVPYFSTWSRQLIVQRIMKLAGETFTLDNFYANDSREIGRDFTSTSRSGDINVYSPTRHRNAPVRINNYKFGKKGAKR